jgi:surface protein
MLLLLLFVPILVTGALIVPHWVLYQCGYSYCYCYLHHSNNNNTHPKSRKRKRKITKNPTVHDEHSRPPYTAQFKRAAVSWYMSLMVFMEMLNIVHGFAPADRDALKIAVDECLPDKNANGDCTTLSYGAIGNWDISRVTSLKGIFAYKSSFNQDLSKWNTTRVTTMEETFVDARSFNSDISKWNTKKVTSMKSMFDVQSDNLFHPFNQDVKSWDTSSLTNTDGMFRGCREFDQDLSKWKTSNLVNMRSMFNRAYAFNSDISKWDVSNVVSMEESFYFAKTFNTDISEWVTSKLEVLRSTFNQAVAFNQDLSKWDVSNVEFDQDGESNMKDIFSHTTSLTNNIFFCSGSWADSTLSGFINGQTSSFNNGLHYFYSSGVTDFSCGDSILRSINIRLAVADYIGNDAAKKSAAITKYGEIEEWDVSRVTSMHNLFIHNGDFGDYVNSPRYDPSTFNHDLSKWVTSKVKFMTNTFAGAKAFNGGKFFCRILLYCTSNPVHFTV